MSQILLPFSCANVLKKRYNLGKKGSSQLKHNFRVLAQTCLECFRLGIALVKQLKTSHLSFVMFLGC